MIVPKHNGFFKYTQFPLINSKKKFLFSLNRAVFKFDGSKIVCSSKGSDFDKFREQFADNERAFGYIRIQTGDEMSKRQKFLFVTWVGPKVSVIKRAKMSTDKSMVKSVVSVNQLYNFNLYESYQNLTKKLEKALKTIFKLRKVSSYDNFYFLFFFQNFAVELQLETLADIELSHFIEELNKAGGANYGTGVREI